jgi:hypothetical protein
MNNTGYFKINNDKWDDCGKIYRLISYHKQGESTGIHVELSINGHTEKRVIPEHQIEWV